MNFRYNDPKCYTSATKTNSYLIDVTVWCRVLLIVFTFLTSSTLYASSFNRLIVYTEEYPPLQFKENGIVSGPATTIVKEVMETAGYSYRIDMLPWARALNNTKKRSNALIYSILRSKKREKEFEWIGIVGHISIGLLSLEDETDIAQINQVKGKTVGVVRGSASHDYMNESGFEDDVTLVLVSSLKEGIRLFINGKVDYLISDKLSVAHMLPKIGKTNIKIYHVFHVEDLTKNLYLAANKNMPPAQINKLRAALSSIKIEAQSSFK